MEIGLEHMTALMKPSGVIIVGATDRPNSVGKGILENIICGTWPTASSSSSSKLLTGDGTSPDWPNLPYKVFPVNPKRTEILGFRCYPRPEDISPKAGADMAVICVPAKSCKDAIKSCGELGSVRALVVIAAGFKEVGAEGLELEQECIKLAKQYNMGITGPNCLGTQSPNFRLNASFAAANARPGHIAFISQSGAICTAILDWSLGLDPTSTPVGFSAFISLGSMAHVEWADWIEYCGEDPETDAIIMYMETVGNAERFLKAAQKVAIHKPIVVIKAGKSEEASAAAASHTGSLTGAYGNFLAAMDRAGCVVLDTIDDLQNIIELISSMGLRKRTFKGIDHQSSSGRIISENIIVVTNAGGPGVLCADAVSEAQLKLYNPLPEPLITSLNAFLPNAWSHNNPIDILGDADERCYKLAIESIGQNLKDDVTILVILTPQSVTKPTETAETIAEIVKNQKLGDPVIICSWMGGPAVQEGRKILQKANIPVFNQPDVAARVLGLFCKQCRLAKKMSPLTDVPRNHPAHELIANLKKKGSKIDDPSSKSITLSEHDSKIILKSYGLKTTGSYISDSLESLESAVKEVGGYPVVLKVHGGKFSHKSDIGGVILNLKTISEVESAFKTIKANYIKLDPNGFEGVTVQPMIGSSSLNTPPHLTKHEASPELIMGCVYDPQFGPMIMFGTGGTYVEILNDTAITLCPISNEKQAAEIVQKTAISKAILNVEGSQRFAQVDPNDLYNTIIKFSVLCADLKEDLLECEMNPLVITKDNKLLALDARIIISK